MYILLRKNNFTGMYGVFSGPGNPHVYLTLDEAKKIKEDNEDYNVLLEIFQLNPVDDLSVKYKK